MIFTSCFNPCTIRTHRGFKVYKNLGNNSSLLKMNGFYACKPNVKNCNFSIGYFYKDGTCYINDGYGIYQIVKDTIRFQYFIHDNQNFITDFPIEKIGKILNDSTISLYQNYCSDCANMYSNYDKNGISKYKSYEIIFLKSAYKPDSSLAFFKKKKWFVKAVKK